MSRLVEIATPDGPMAVTAWDTETEGVVVHLRHGSETDWVVTHERTGHRIHHGGLVKKEAALRLAALLGQPVTPPDWTKLESPDGLEGPHHAIVAAAVALLHKGFA